MFHLLNACSPRPYKAPELLFSHAELSSTLLDLWSLGVTLAQFFTTISETSTPAPIDQDSADDLSAADMALPPWATSFIRPKQVPSARTDLYRELFRLIIRSSGQKAGVSTAMSL